MHSIDLNSCLFVGIDAHPTEHTAVIINRFEEEQGILRFDNSKDGIVEFSSWLSTSFPKLSLLIGIEGGGNSRHALIANLLKGNYPVYEVNPLYTKQRRSLSTRPDKSDPADAKIIAGVLTTKLSELPKINSNDLSSFILTLKKAVWFYEEITAQGVAIQNQLHQLKREKDLSIDSKEKKLLTLIISKRTQELKAIRNTQRQFKLQLNQLLSVQGNNLTTVKGISTVLAAKIVSHSGGIGRFDNLDGFIRYAGISPKEKSSGKSKRHVKSHSGNRKLNYALYLAAMLQLRWSPKAKEYFDKKVKEGKTKKHALKCLMKRTACIIYGMLRSGEDFRG